MAVVGCGTWKTVEDSSHLEATGWYLVVYGRAMPEFGPRLMFLLLLTGPSGPARETPSSKSWTPPLVGTISEGSRLLPSVPLETQAANCLARPPAASSNHCRTSMKSTRTRSARSEAVRSGRRLGLIRVPVKIYVRTSNNGNQPYLFSVRVMSYSPQYT